MFHLTVLGHRWRHASSHDESPLSFMLLQISLGEMVACDERGTVSKPDSDKSTLTLSGVSRMLAHPLPDHSLERTLHSIGFMRLPHLSAPSASSVSFETGSDELFISQNACLQGLSRNRGLLQLLHVLHVWPPHLQYFHGCYVSFHNSSPNAP